jgi:hypothetical protein
MSKPQERRSLMDSIPRPPKDSPSPVEVSPDSERRIMNFPEIVQPTIQPVVQPTDTVETVSFTARVSKRRPEPSILTVKIPKPIHTLLKRTSQFNDVPMGEIVARALDVELKNYKRPPKQWGGEE